MPRLPQSPRSPLTRRAFAALLTGCAAGGALTVLSGCAPQETGTAGTVEDAEARAFTFLNDRVDDAAGTPPGLPVSYTGGHFARQPLAVAFTYDVALVIVAYCARAASADLRRASALAQVLLDLQVADPEHDGRLRQSYASGKLTGGHAVPDTAAADTFTGTQAWAGLALLHAHHATAKTAFRDGAVRLARWIYDRTYEKKGVAGYTSGIRADGTALTHKATEHNIDVAAFYRCLADATGDDTWSGRADDASAFVDAMWDAGTGAFWTGTAGDGATVNRSTVPEDIQTWSYLAVPSQQYQGSVDWARTRLAAEDHGFTGVSVSDADTSKVWFEGTSHLAAALQARDGSGDRAHADDLLSTLRSAQATAPNADGHGIVAASSDGLKTGDGDTLYASLHTGTTAWFTLAAAAANPFTLDH